MERLIAKTLHIILQKRRPINRLTFNYLHKKVCFICFCVFLCIPLCAKPNIMTGEIVRQKIKEKGFTFHSIAQAIGESDANLRCMLLVKDVKSGTIERIAKAMGENVSYFYEEHPVFSVEEYAAIHSLKQENTLLRQLLNEKERIIELLMSKK